MAKKIETRTRWRPDLFQIAWTVGLIGGMKDGADWVAPAMGVFTINKQAKTLTLTVKFTGCDNEMLERTVVAFERCGYTVLDGTKDLN